MGNILNFLGSKKSAEGTTVNPMAMVMEFLTDKNKLKETLTKQLYPAVEEKLLNYIDKVELNEDEVMTGIILFKNGEGKLDYVLCTFDNEDRVLRQLEVNSVQEKLTSLADNLKIF